MLQRIPQSKSTGKGVHGDNAVRSATLRRTHCSACCFRHLFAGTRLSMMSERILLGFAAALGSGLLIGIERERRKGRGPHRALAGVRTFSLAAVAGAGARSTGQDILVIAGAALIVVLAGISYWRDRSRDPGVTTEMALFVTYILGVVAMGEPALAAGGAVVVTTLLASRSSLHRFSIDVHVVCRRSFWGIGCAGERRFGGVFRCACCGNV